MKYQTTKEIELKIAYHLGIRENLIVPNVSWGFNIHECDLLSISSKGYLTEVEIKISLSDLKKDKEKYHGHYDDRIKYLYFAIPAKLAKHIEYIPKRAGIFIITTKGRVYKIAKPKYNKKANPISDKDKYKIARLGALRIWKLKEKIIESKSKC
jgi:hypothetical protein